MFPFATLQDDGEALQEQFARDRIKGNEPEVYACLDGPDNPPKKRYAGGGGSWGGNEWDYSAFKNNAWVLSFFVNDWIPIAGQIDDVVPAVVGIYSVVQFTIDNQEKIAESIFTLTNGDKASFRKSLAKGSTKNERKINPKVKSAADQKVEELENQLKNAKTNNEREKIKQQLKHWRLKGNQKSEPHGRGSGRH